MKLATLSALVVGLGSLAFGACSSGDSGGGNTGGTTTVGGGGAGGTVSGGAGGTVSGGAGGAGGAGATSGSGGAGAGSCKDKCGSSEEQPGGCYCDSACESKGDCCTDYKKECPEPPPVKLPAGCVTNSSFKTYCNPVTNEGCKGSEACDFMQSGVKCYPDGNTEPAGAPCEPDKGKYCIPTYTCDGVTQSTPVGVCKKFCCADSDCGGGKCVAINAQLGTLGLCESASDGGTDGGGADGGGADGGGNDAAADAGSD